MSESMRQVGKILPVILSGGAGSRLWPASRAAAPKQMLPLATDKTMIQETVLRFGGEMYHNPVFICSANHAVIIQAQMDEINVEVGGFLIEPLPRNTAAPAVIAALHALSLEEDALVLVVPADHHIEKPEAFRRAVAAGAPVAAHGHLMTFGITPDYAATGFGYIRKGLVSIIGILGYSCSMLRRSLKRWKVSRRSYQRPPAPPMRKLLLMASCGIWTKLSLRPAKARQLIKP